MPFCNWAPFVIGYFVGQWYVALSFKGVFVQGGCRKKRKSGAEFLFSVSLGYNVDLSIFLHHSLADCHCLTDSVHVTKEEGITSSVREGKNTSNQCRTGVPLSISERSHTTTVFRISYIFQVY